MRKPVKVIPETRNSKQMHSQMSTVFHTAINYFTIQLFLCEMELNFLHKFL